MSTTGKKGGSSRVGGGTPEVPKTAVLKETNQRREWVRERVAGCIGCGVVRATHLACGRGIKNDVEMIVSSGNIVR